MTVSIANMAQVWMSNTNTYNGIAMSISTMGYGANSASRLFRLRVDGNTKVDIDANGNITANSITVNTIIASSTANAITTAALSVSGNVGIGTASPTVSLDIGSKTDSVKLPVGTTAQQPTTITSAGQIRHNSTINRVEEYVSGFWLNNQNGYTNVTGKTRVVTQYSGAGATWTVPAGVTFIFVKMWGAGGGGGSYGGWRQGSTGGAGGYSEGILSVTAGQTVSMRVGQNGFARWGANKAYPDGGGASTAAGDNQYAGAGGGSTSIAVPNLNSGTWCMYAGGGGGGGSLNGFGRNPGGAGGGLQGEDAFTELTSYTPYSVVGKRGTQSAGGAAPSGSNTTGGAGSANQGGTHQNGNCYAGGGGGGYFGGSSGAYTGSNSMAGGGGGSGFIHSGVIRGITLTGSREYPPMKNDPDAIEYSVSGYRIGFGGDEGASGGYGLIVIYY